MRRLFTTDDATERGLTRSELHWGANHGRWRRIDRQVWAEGPEAASRLDLARAAVLATGGVASHHLAGVLHGLDSVTLDGPWVSVPPAGSGRRSGVRRRELPPGRIVTVEGLRCTDGLQTVVDLARTLTDLVWEQSLESALRKGSISVAEIEREMGGRGVCALRARRVLGLRPPGARPTESLLETLMVQLARSLTGLPECVRQFTVEDDSGGFVARLDLAWPDLGLFVELDGQHHKDQPVYDARRETAVVAATGWLCGRFTWTEVVRLPHSTARRLGALAEQARRRPLRTRSASQHIGRAGSAS